MGVHIWYLEPVEKKHGCPNLAGWLAAICVSAAKNMGVHVIIFHD
jgi:hypothetical protein